MALSHSDVCVEGATRDAVPQISIVIPTYNRAKWLPRSIGSVKSQSFTDWELLVVDDGSTDDSAALVARMAAVDPRIRLLKNQRTKGVSGARNTGIDAARGEFIAFLDSDDEWFPEHLERSVNLLTRESHPIEAVCGSAERRLTATGEIFLPAQCNWNPCIQRSLDAGDLLDSNKVFDSYVRSHAVLEIQAFVVRRSAISDSRFPEDLRLGEDGIFFMLLANAGVGCLRLHNPHVVLWAHDANTTTAGDRCLGADELIRLHSDYEKIGEKMLATFQLTDEQRRNIRRSMAAGRFWQVGYRGHLLEKRYAEARWNFRIAMKWHPGNFAFMRTFALSYVRQALGR